MSRFKHVISSVLALAFIASTAFAQDDSSKRKAQPKIGTSLVDNAQDLVFLGEARPVLIRITVEVDGKPLGASLDAFVKHLFDYLDRNHDGVLSKEEAEHVPTLEQVLSGGVTGGLGLGGGRGRNNNASPRPTLAILDLDKNGKVSQAELAEYYRKSGLTPFQFQLTGAPAAFNVLSLLGGSRSEPGVKEVREAFFKLLDTNNDGKLSKEELVAAPVALLSMDEDDDEMIGAHETAPDAAGANPLAGIAMMVGKPVKKDPAEGNSQLVPILAGGDTSHLVRRLQERYGKETPEKISNKVLKLDEVVFAKLDADKDGTLSPTELAAFAKREPDIDIAIRIGAKEGVKPVHVGRCVLGNRVSLRAGSLLLDLGLTRAELMPGGSEQGGQLAGIVRQQYVAQFHQADTDGNGYLDEKEAKASRQFKDNYKAMDRDGDGKVTEKEMIAFLDAYNEIQEKAKAACVTLVFSDESRGLFELFDTNADRHLSVREMRRGPELFNLLDRSSKGFITADDVPSCYRMTIRRGPASSGLSGANVFVSMYLTGYGEEAKAGPTAGPMWFRKMDRNRDGDVSRREFLGTDEQFQKIDADGDGLISLEEAIRFDEQQRKVK